MAVEHENLVKRVLVSLSSLPRTRVWSNPTGTARSFDGKRVIRYGLIGSADVIGLSNGRFIAIEIKVGKDYQKEAQKNFQNMIESCGGLYFIVKSEKDIEEIKRVL